ncbi:MAG TPA: TetR/AcrR family transcriptional regulator [Spirochaetota bacterium]|jgi:AcrR family transcriptional regulator|nr:TetR/AcrR family transcriptional regulator [Spirochaetota bacterium]HOF34370.1 TetR/AcrR family transcriptional regulator [Spirochaetota bacterium]HOR44589.1 TetR/AcrR family transcriptional regulator [Spirochaetota bacterium]HPJ14170.1 TetR/AcrR family transcriptional regulator [Spirochaetota bacterium]HPK56004.1 TetR/AcrR family transcriptional regulator [Spirochaetota bacterium]
MPAKGQKRKNQIIDAAKEMFIERGYQSTHIGEICDNLDIARGTVYQYFGNKREIVYSILESLEEKIEDIFDSDDLVEFIKSDPTGDEISQFIRKKFSNCVSAVIEEPIVIMLMYKEIIGLDEDVTERTERFVDNVIKIIAKDLAELSKKGIYRQDIDPLLTSLLIFGSVQLLIHEYRRKGKDILDNNVVQSVVDMIMKGMMP